MAIIAKDVADLTSNSSTETERRMIQGGEDPKHHRKATAQPGGHAVRAGEICMSSGRM